MVLLSTLRGRRSACVTRTLHEDVYFDAPFALELKAKADHLPEEGSCNCQVIEHARPPRTAGHLSFGRAPSSGEPRRCSRTGQSGCSCTDLFLKAAQDYR